MNGLRFILALAFIALTFVAPMTVCACPLCAEAIANSNATEPDDDKDNFPAAMNQSIYLMLAVPYSMLGIVGFMIYRGVKKNEAFRQSLDENDPDPSNE